ncbi:hypothetical protein GQ53DRAFT_829991 [Thozetella sp. PMI_491]|nr:hypothetical protein GQ53DRAFT_829991 [Thozetella sp. PMI_491]
MDPRGPKCYLLQLPRETRQQVYDLVIHLDTPGETAWRFSCMKGSFKGSYASVVKTSDAKFSIPWVNLLSVCKAIRAEMKAYMDRPSLFQGEINRSWAVELVVEPLYKEWLNRHFVLGPVRWLQIPCSPAKVETLHANIIFPRAHSHFWGNGGLQATLWQLHQALNSTLHYGPTFGLRDPLPLALRLKTLVIQVSRESPQSPSKIGIEGNRRRDEASRVEPSKTFGSLCDYLRQLNRTGLLWGFIDNVRVIDQGGHQEDLEATFVENVRVPAYWASYGFVWGVAEHDEIAKRR